MQANGRINILSYNPNDRFILHDKIPTGQSTSYRDALNGNWESSSLSNSFFSASNIRTIQNKLKEGVLKISNGSFVIGDQDEDTLKIIMRSIFLQHSTNQRNNIEGQINALNTLVLNYAIPQVYGEAQGYIQYRKDVSTLAVPITFTS